MRTSILLSSLILLSAMGAMAQNDSNSGSVSVTPSVKATIEGCLQGAVGNYTLFDYAGASYLLTGDTEQLKAHDGETIRVTGAISPVVNVPGAISEGTNTQPTLSVISFKQLSSVCSDADNLP